MYCVFFLVCFFLKFYFLFYCVLKNQYHYRLKNQHQKILFILCVFNFSLWCKRHDAYLTQKNNTFFSEKNTFICFSKIKWSCFPQNTRRGVIDFPKLDSLFRKELQSTNLKSLFVFFFRTKICCCSVREEKCVFFVNVNNFLLHTFVCIKRKR